MSRRWTVLLIPHDSEAPVSIAVSARTLRFLTSLAVAIALVALIGLGTIIAQLGRIGPVGANRASSPSPAPSAELALLRSRVSQLHGALDTIRAADYRLRELAGVPAAYTAKMMRNFISRVPSFRGSGKPASARASATTFAGRPASSAIVGDARHARAVADSLAARANRIAADYGALADSAARGTRGPGREPR
jgi:hypothetical protein